MKHTRWTDSSRWLELCDFVADGGLGTIPESAKRSDKSQFAYDAQKAELGYEGAVARIKQNLLNNGKRDDFGYGRLFLLELNSFPYDELLNGQAEHYVFWFQWHRFSLSEAADLVADCLGVARYRVFVFENSAAAKSIPDVPHYQVFVKL